MKQLSFSIVFKFIFLLVLFIAFSCSVDNDFEAATETLEITDIRPRIAGRSDTITIIGTNFGLNKDNVSVIINGAPLEIISLSDTEIVVIVLDSVTSGLITVNVVGRGSISAGNFAIAKTIGDIHVQQVTTREGSPITFDVILSKSVPGGTTLRTVITNQYIDNEDYNIEGLQYSVDAGETWLRESISTDILIAENQKIIKVRIPTIDDNIIEGGETLLVSFENIGNGDLAIEDEAVVMLIEDNDSRGLSLVNSAIIQYAITKNKNLSVRTTISPLTSLDQKKYFEDVAKHNQIWETVKQLIPKQWLDRIIGLEIIYDTRGLLGYVYPVVGLNKWVLGLNVNYSYGSSGRYVNPGRFNYQGILGGTLVHEMGHINTLNQTQINQSVSQGNCQTFYSSIERGCFAEDAHLYGLYRDFWLARGQQYLNFHDNNPRRFYFQNITDFVSRYASTNEAEDIAETIRHFSAQQVIPASTSESSVALRKLNYIKSIPLFDDLKGIYRSSGVDIGQSVTQNIRSGRWSSQELKNISGGEAILQVQSCLNVENNWD